MKKSEQFQREKTGNLGYVNKNCWLVKALNYSPYKRCQYCEFKFHNCLFLHYQIISLILIIFFLTLSFLIEGKISKLGIIFVFALIVIYGYFFNKSTEKIINANFAQKKAKEALEELNEKLEEQVEQRTKELRKAYDELKVLSKAKSEFISMASHQLRTPLTSIKGYVSMLLDGDYGELGKDKKQALSNVFQSSERLIKLVGELLDISKIELGKIELNKNKTQIELLIRSCCEELNQQAKEKKLALVFQEPKTFLPKVKIDELKIRQVILNIIDNAIRYTKQGKIEVGIEQKKDSILIAIKDTGDGLTEKETGQIFEGFIRGSAGADFFADGAGLGLYVSKKYIDIHNGKIWVVSPGKGKGATFFVELPIGIKD